jgi:hypothetical protein
MTTTFKVLFWEIADWAKANDKKKKKGRPYGVRWVTRAASKSRDHGWVVWRHAVAGVFASGW